ncbi:MAG: GDP-mannose 4,6-dehydratase [Sphingobacteriales bacterium]|nr:MAG: GDP-mannose 4,6-dehydratase [Sphingobacteriales bacterium]
MLVTGGAGFIGSSLIDSLLLDKENYILSIDNYDDFYDIAIKKSNQKNHFENPNFRFIQTDIRKINDIKLDKEIDCIIHLAAKAGVRPSIEDAHEYFDTNINGTLAMLEFAKKNKIQQFIFASSSSVYGINQNIPWSENETDMLPISPYASSKLAAEKIGFTYSYLYNIRFIALRFFTVYGPKQRPDLAIQKFFNKILNNQPIEMYGSGNTFRDYTYIDDIIQGIIGAINYNRTMYEVINLGNNTTINLEELIYQIGKVTQLSPKIIQAEYQVGDVPKTYANIEKGKKILNYNPKIEIHEGLMKQYEWIKKIKDVTKDNS